MRSVKPGSRLWKNIILITIAGIMLFWLPSESSDPIIALTLSIIITTAGSLEYITKKEVFPNRYLLAGLVAGLLVTLIALGLMIFKTGVHAHPVPDYSIDQIRWILLKTPLMMLGGAMIGFGAALLHSKRKTTHS